MTFSVSGGALLLLLALVLLLGPAAAVGLCARYRSRTTALFATALAMSGLIVGMGGMLLLFYGRARLPDGLDGLFREAFQGVGAVGGRLLVAEGVAMVTAGAFVGFGLFLIATAVYVGYRARRTYLAMNDL